MKNYNAGKNMIRKWFNIIALIILALAINACKPYPAVCTEECEDGAHCQKKCGPNACVEADDWGYPKVWVPADGTGVDDSGVQRAPKGEYPRQLAYPVNSGQRLLNASEVPLVITTSRKEQWTSWFGGEINMKAGQPNPDGWDGGRVVPNKECRYFITNGDASAEGGPVDDLSPATIWASYTDSNSKFYLESQGKQISSNILINGTIPVNPLHENSLVTCYFRYGIGLYVGLAPSGGDVEDSTLVGARQSDVIFTYHIPDSKKPGVALNTGVDENTNMTSRMIDGYLVRGYAKNELPGAETGDTLFFKIVDNYYTDNSGGYTVKIKEGTRDPRPGPLESVISMVIDPIFVVMHRVYEGIVTNPTFINLVRAAVALYIVFYGFTFIVGGLDEAKKAVAVRLFKLTIVFMVISPSSWDFFYNHMFAAFIKGVTEIAGMLMSPFDSYDPQHPWYAMDNFLARIFSEATQAKIWSTLFSNWAGFIIVLALFFAIFLFAVALFKAVLLYIVAMIVIALMVVMTPIFIIFILFDRTKKLFEEVLGQFFATSVEIILLLASLGMFAAIIVMFMERNLGYNVCYNTVIDFDLFGIKDLHVEFLTLKFWMPHIGTDMANIWMDVDGDGVRSVNPPEMAYRYIDLPYFDPNIDKDVIARYMSETNFLDPADVGIFIAAVFLMYAFIEFVPSVATLLKGGGQIRTQSASIFGNSMSMNSALFNTMKATAFGVGGTAQWAAGKAGGMAYGRAMNAMKRSGGASSTATGAAANQAAANQGIKGRDDSSTNIQNLQNAASSVGSALNNAFNKYVGSFGESGSMGPVTSMQTAASANKDSERNVKHEGDTSGFSATVPTPHGEAVTQDGAGRGSVGTGLMDKGVGIDLDKDKLKQRVEKVTGELMSAAKSGNIAMMAKSLGEAEALLSSLDPSERREIEYAIANARSAMANAEQSNRPE